jgi:hypothetical protein
MTQDAYTALLERMAAGEPPTIAELATQLGHSDPRMAMLAQVLARRAEAAAAREEEPDPVRPERRAQAVGRLRQLAESMYRELDHLRGRVGELAAALGACSACWGEAPDCPECGGRGTPGCYPPDRVLFRRLVVPAVRRLPGRPTAPADETKRLTPDPPPQE